MAEWHPSRVALLQGMRIGYAAAKAERGMDEVEM